MHRQVITYLINNAAVIDTYKTIMQTTLFFYYYCHTNICQCTYFNWWLLMVSIWFIQWNNLLNLITTNYSFDGRYMLHFWARKIITSILYKKPPWLGRNRNNKCVQTYFAAFSIRNKYTSHLLILWYHITFTNQSMVKYNLKFIRRQNVLSVLIFC